MVTYRSEVKLSMPINKLCFLSQDDKKLWLSSSAGAAELDIEMSCFLLREIGDQFCELLLQEKEAASHHLNDGIYHI